MVTAYLRGNLKPRHNHGLRSALAENLILEAVAAEVSADGMELGTLIDAAASTVIKPAARQEHLRSVFTRAGRVSELRLFDIHRLGSQSSGSRAKLSVFQLYQVLEKNGILSAMKDYHKALDNQTPQP